MDQLYFFSYRVAMIFILAYIGLFSHLRFGMMKTALILTGVFVVSTAIDYLSIFHSEGGLYYLLTTVTIFSILIVIGQLISKRKGWGQVFTVLCATDFILPGNIICYIVYNHTNDIFSSVLVQIMSQSLVLFVLVKLVSKDYKGNTESINGLRNICFVPLLFYMCITLLTVWPMNLIEYPVALPGVLFLFVLMGFTFTCGVRIYTRNGQKQKQDMSLVFLAEYSDRIKNESAKVNAMSSKIEEMSCAMMTVTSEILEFLDKEQYDDIRTLVSAIMSDSKLVITERRCANNSINSVILEADEYAKRSGIAVTYKLNVPETLGPIEFEYAVVVERLMNHAIKGCSQFYSKQLSVSMYPSGAWMNIEMRAQISDCNSMTGEVKEYSPETKEKIKSITENIDYSLGLPELNAFMKKYEVQHSVQFKMGMMISEFNVRIN